MAYGNICSPITELLEYRYDKRLPTLISTNLTPPMITQRYSERVGDRLKEMMDVVVFEADSYRR
jgi:DNA replication protein DnaC